MSSNNRRRLWESLRVFAGLDWGRKTHQLHVLDRDGHKQLTIGFEHAAAGWDRLGQALRNLVGQDLSVIGVAIETRVGPAVEKLLELGCTVYPMNPKAASRYRDRKAPSGDKNDDLDARSFAAALRTDGYAWRAMEPEDPLTQQLRLLCRDEVRLIERRTARVNELRQALHEYYPAALEAFDDWTLPGAWAFVKRFPTPAKLVKAGKRRWEKFLHTQKLYRPQTYRRRIEVFGRATDFCGPEAVTQAKSLLAVGLVEQLQLIRKQIELYRHEINRLFDQHPNREIFDSLPGAGEKLAPRLLSECAPLASRFDDAEALECYAGTAPVRYQSGQIEIVKVRRACNKPLRYAVHLWANASRTKSTWAEVYYRRKREQGKSHACALRCLANRWLKILWRMLETGQPYDEAYHMGNQIRHGSWVFQPAS